MRGPQKYAEGRPSWIDLATSDLEAAKDFYSAIFGWTYRQAEPEGSGYFYAIVNGHAVAGLARGQNPDRRPTWTTYLAADSADIAAERAEAAGATILVAPMTVGPAGRMAYLIDPVGAAIGLWEGDAHRGAGLVNHPGAFTWAELHAQDTEEAAAFYNAAFGLVAAARDFGPDAPAYVVFEVGGVTVAGTMPPPGPEAASHWHVYIGTDSADACAARVAELGGTVRGGGVFDTPVGRMATVEDPQGATFSVIELTEWPQ